jgi:PTS system beta-glucosides-specific IIC component
LGELSDPVFARGLLGPGVAIRPSSGLVRSPARGRISTIARARHGIGITTDEGAEILIHIGIDTVHLAGRHMDVLVTQGQRVEGGQPIAHVEIGALTAEGHGATTPMVITNAAAFGALRIVAPSEVVASGDALLELQVHPTASRTGRTPVTTPDGRLAEPPA